jgi:uncharacterized protein (DUF1015 family)
VATVRPFRAIRPTPDSAAKVAAVPYDVVDTEEARALAAGNPLSFLHVSRAEIDLPPGTDPHSDKVYRLAAERYRQLKLDAPLLREKAPSVYLYRLHLDGHSQTGIAACYSLDEYDSDLIKKHERTRRDKEDDRTRHMVELSAQTGPVFLTFKPLPVVDAVTKRATAAEPLFGFRAIDGVQHTIWRLARANADAVVGAFAGVNALYIADGHHRAASAARARQHLEGSEEANFFLAVAFPSDHVRILPYNRIVRDLHGHIPDGFLGELARRGFVVKTGPPTPEHKGEVSMYIGGAWYFLDLESAPPAERQAGGDPRVILDCNILQERVLGPVLGIGDIRTDPRIDFVGGARGTNALEQLVDSGRAAVAFSMYPVSVNELMAVSDAGSIMPPKSTWFEPKLRDGLLIHEI